jgi:predicted metalloenzyme YecM
MKTNQDVIGDYNSFLDHIFTMFDELDLAVKIVEVDHLCYRVKTLDAYKAKKIEFNEIGELLIESIVNGRNICTYKLKDPIVYKDKTISLIELPAPKNSHSYENGLEHLEFVTKEPLQKIVDRHPHLMFETFGINKKINADITLKLGDYCIRFHNQSLEDVIKLEKRGRR